MGTKCNLFVVTVKMAFSTIYLVLMVYSHVVEQRQSQYKDLFGLSLINSSIHSCIWPRNVLCSTFIQECSISNHHYSFISLYLPAVSCLSFRYFIIPVMYSRHRICKNVHQSPAPLQTYALLLREFLKPRNVELLRVIRPKFITFKLLPLSGPNRLQL